MFIFGYHFRSGEGERTVKRDGYEIQQVYAVLLREKKTSMISHFSI